MTSKTELNFPKINDIGSWDLESQMEVKQEVDHSNRYFGNIKKKIIATIAAVVILCFASGLFIMIIQDDNRNMRKFFNGSAYKNGAYNALGGKSLLRKNRLSGLSPSKKAHFQQLLAQREAKKAALAAKKPSKEYLDKLAKMYKNRLASKRNAPQNQQLLEEKPTEDNATTDAGAKKPNNDTSEDKQPKEKSEDEEVEVEEAEVEAEKEVEEEAKDTQFKAEPVVEQLIKGKAHGEHKKDTEFINDQEYQKGAKEAGIQDIEMTQSADDRQKLKEAILRNKAEKGKQQM